MSGGYSVVVAGTTITASRENQYVSRQVVTRFANSAARDSAIATDAEEGMYADLADVNYLTRHDGTNWSPGVPVRLNNAAWTTQTSATTTETQITSSAMTWTAVTGKYYRIAFCGQYVGTNATDNIAFRIRHAPGATVSSAATLLAEHVITVTGNNYSMPITIDDVIGGVSGQRTVALFVVRYNGSGTVYWNNGIASRCYCELVDIGAN